jgi:hypothetical protein
MGPTAPSPLPEPTAGETAPTGDFARSGWQPDKSGRFDERYLASGQPTELVRMRATESVDPLGTTGTSETTEHQADTSNESLSAVASYRSPVRKQRATLTDPMTAQRRRLTVRLVVLVIRR